MTLIDRAFMTGCDSQNEWLLPWFFENYKRHNSDTLYVADFGLSERGKEFVMERSSGLVKLRQYQPYGQNWFKKPEAIYNADAHMVVWLDTDCEVLGDLTGIFKLLTKNQLSMVEDRPWTARSGQKWHNSGVVGVVGRPEILAQWSMECIRQAGPFPTEGLRGDQEVLHYMLQNPKMREIYINELPNEYNWLRLQLIDGQDSPKKLVMHWTGAKGKEEIRRKIRERGTLDWERKLGFPF